MNVGSLFSGIGGIDLGFERAGYTIAWQCESDPWCRSILARHWPDVPCYRDVRHIGTDCRDCGGSGIDGTDLPCPYCYGKGRIGTPVDVLAGGFPCQPVSQAGKRLRQADERWLWPAFERAIRDLRPRYVVVENVPGLLAGGMGDVLGDLAALGFDAEWLVFGARDVGAPHRRDRVWIIAWDSLADPVRPRRREDARSAPRDEGEDAGRAEADDHQPDGDGQGDRDGHVAHTDGEPWPARGERTRSSSVHETSPPRRPSEIHGRAWPPEPDVRRVAHGIPDRLHRLRGLGNAVVPACAEHVGRLLLDLDRELSAA